MMFRCCVPTVTAPLMNRCCPQESAPAVQRRVALVAPAAADVLGCDEIFVIDPLNRTGKIRVPLRHALETKGLTEALQAAEIAAFATAEDAPARDLSLCLLFQKGRCNAGARCRQIHVDVEFVESVRAAACSSNNCCAHHGDAHSQHLTRDPRSVVVIGDRGCVGEYPMAAFASTKGLEAVAVRISGAVIKVGANAICRLHSQGRCKFGRDCRNVHLCLNGAHDVTMQLQRAEAQAAVMPSLESCCSIARGSACSTPRSDRSGSNSSATFGVAATRSTSVVMDSDVTPVKPSQAARAPMPADFDAVQTAATPVASMLAMPIVSTPPTPPTTTCERRIVSAFSVTSAAVAAAVSPAAQDSIFSRPLTKSSIGVAQAPKPFAWGFEDLVASVCCDILSE